MTLGLFNSRNHFNLELGTWSLEQSSDPDQYQVRNSLIGNKLLPIPTQWVVCLDCSFGP